MSQNELTTDEIEAIETIDVLNEDLIQILGSHVSDGSTLGLLVTDTSKHAYGEPVGLENEPNIGVELYIGAEDLVNEDGTPTDRVQVSVTGGELDAALMVR